MEELYVKLIELLEQVGDIRYIDMDIGQLNEEVPPLSYPACLIDIALPSCSDIQSDIQQVSAIFSVKVITKSIGETNSLTPEQVRAKSLEYLSLQDKVYKKLQGYEDSSFYSFSRKSVQPSNLRKDLKISVLTFETSFHDYTASS
ncbi:hypothetical protein [Myroides odoratimimus]|uniref:hypothetical protein n=1 Tax=Myroides odoratimimus TaxID=76832 RepID=UPI002577F1A1|nr:hypothetical protein [Myroides odoratimimus]MDM1093409.1 hypothetical protein [Myroides odoratimimus]